MNNEQLDLASIYGIRPVQAAIAHQGRSLLRRILPRLPQATEFPR